MGGRRVPVLDRVAVGDSPLAHVTDEGGLWSFRLHGDPNADLVLILLPAMGVPVRYYDPLVKEFLNSGVAVVRADFLAERVIREPSRPLDGFAALVEGCIPSILRTIRVHLPAASPVIVGHSLGGQIGLIAAARFAPEIPVVLAASGSAWYRAFSDLRRLVYLVGSQAINGIATMLPYWPGDVLGFGGRQPRALIRDWSRVVRTGRYQTRTGTFDYETVLGEYRGDVLVIDITDDVLAPPAATNALLAKASPARVDRRAYVAGRGTARPGAHFTWVRDRSGFGTVIVSWARERRP